MEVHALIIAVTSVEDAGDIEIPGRRAVRVRIDVRAQRNFLTDLPTESRRNVLPNHDAAAI